MEGRRVVGAHKAHKRKQKMGRDSNLECERTFISVDNNVMQDACVDNSAFGFIIDSLCCGIVIVIWGKQEIMKMGICFEGRNN